MNSAQAARGGMGSGHVRPSESPFPDLEALAAGLTPVFSSNGFLPGPFIILGRQTNSHSSTFASEVVTCQFLDGSESRVFCKYGADYLDDGSVRRGVPYEVEVYRHVLARLQLSAPRFYGSYEEGATGRAWLILEYLDNCSRVSNTTEQNAMRLAARWIGRFHAVNEEDLSSASISRLNTYNAEYYAAWRRRMSVIPNRLGQIFPWLPNLCERSDEFVAPLLTAPPTIIHGEFYPGNVLIRDGNVYVVDWESAGVGAGELDLAALTLGAWPEEVIRDCEEEYQLIRWFEGPPSDFDRTLAAARLYFYFKCLFRLLRLPPDRVAQDARLFAGLRSAGERLGLI